jgi:hypothetical protein
MYTKCSIFMDKMQYPASNLVLSRTDNLIRQRNNRKKMIQFNRTLDFEQIQKLKISEYPLTITSNLQILSNLRTNLFLSN